MKKPQKKAEQSWGELKARNLRRISEMRGDARDKYDRVYEEDREKMRKPPNDSCNTCYIVSFISMCLFCFIFLYIFMVVGMPLVDKANKIADSAKLTIDDAHMLVWNISKISDSANVLVEAANTELTNSRDLLIRANNELLVVETIRLLLYNISDTNVLAYNTISEAQEKLSVVDYVDDLVKNISKTNDELSIAVKELRDSIETTNNITRNTQQMQGPSLPVTIP